MTSHHKRRPVLDRLLDRVRVDDTTGCWEWTGAKIPQGYGFMSVRDGDRWVPRYVHRLAFEAYKGPITDGLDVMHSCDNRACCNPDHLSLGTRLDNMRDAKAKGRRLGRKPNPDSKRQRAMHAKATKEPPWGW